MLTESVGITYVEGYQVIVLFNVLLFYYKRESRVGRLNTFPIGIKAL